MTAHTANFAASSFFSGSPVRTTLVRRAPAAPAMPSLLQAVPEAARSRLSPRALRLMRSGG